MWPLFQSRRRSAMCRISVKPSKVSCETKAAGGGAVYAWVDPFDLLRIVARIEKRQEMAVHAGEKFGEIPDEMRIAEERS